MRFVAMLVVLALVAGLTIPAVQTQNSSQPAPVLLPRDEDFARTRALLGITGPPPAGASGSSPVPFDETTANPLPTLHDPLRLNNGQRANTAPPWNNQRRAELLEVFEREVYGRTPKVTPKVTWEVLSTTREMNGDVPIITKQLVGRVDNSAYPALTVNLLASVSTPANRPRSPCTPSGPSPTSPGSPKASTSSPTSPPTRLPPGSPPPTSTSSPPTAATPPTRLVMSRPNT